MGGEKKEHFVREKRLPARKGHLFGKGCLGKREKENLKIIHLGGKYSGERKEETLKVIYSEKNVYPREGEKP